MHRRILVSVLATGCLASLIVGFMVPKSFEMGRQSRREEDTTKPSEMLEAKQTRIDTTKTKPMTKADSIRFAKADSMMIMKDIEYYRTKVPGLIKELQDTSLDPDKRQDCAYYLGRSRDPRAVPPLINALHDKWPQVRQGAIQGLVIACHYLRNEELIIPHLKKTLKDSTIRVQLTTANALIALGDSVSPISTLVSIFKKELPSFREPLETWIKKEILRPDLPDSEQVRIAEYAKMNSPKRALNLLLKIRNEEVKDALIEATKSKDEWVSSEARKALQQIEE
ncbi:hypothetical protein CH333_07770 [candidate division WOR-3 bacterium JGI_Cruoil_03_44_89]|uniref:HEAT repeat domain-containing protein n=1 Tax=candidate division WOR-3 bacterium JGI_Cruoil_03_44_89 TaxID=1973748 RepID=A0A235BQQ5_UNCW3|nr:MAG: hypothetical protein CH333_07770 [candidate division WOR-3 bacterium JGI_Cruoil_03_44_89]